MCGLIERASFSSNLIIQGHIYTRSKHKYVWADMFMKSTCIKFEHRPEGATGLAINQRQMIEWAPSFVRRMR